MGTTGQIILWVIALIPATFVLAMILGVTLMRYNLKRQAKQIYAMSAKAAFNNNKKTADDLKALGDSLMKLSKQWKL